MDSFLPFSDGVDLTEKEQERRSSTSSSATEDSGYSSIFRTINSVRVYSSKDEYLVAMIEDLSIWLQINHFIDIRFDNFFDFLESGVILCKQAQMVQLAGERFVTTRNSGSYKLPGKWSNCSLTLPSHFPKFSNRQPCQTFVSRDNITNFICWLRLFGFNESIMFETEDLMSRRNLRNIVLALLELARVGGLFGLNVPNLIEMEQEIDAEILCKTETPKQEQSFNWSIGFTDEKEEILPSVDECLLSNKIATKIFVKQSIKSKPYVAECDIRSLDEMVREILLECECNNQFPMSRLSEGKYLFGEKDLLIFVRILRSHVMVRVGGGWDTLNNLLYKHDTCRRDKPAGNIEVSATNHRYSKPFINGYSKSPSVQHQLKASLSSKRNRETQSAEIEQLSTRISNIPSSYNQGKKSIGKVNRRCSLQQPRKPDISATLASRGSKIPVLCRNLRTTRKIPLFMKNIDLQDFTDTNSAPCSRRQSPTSIRRLVPWK